MQNKWKKTMAGVLSVCLVATFIPQVDGIREGMNTKETVQAAIKSKTSSGNSGGKTTWKYNAKTKTVTISGKGEMYDYESPEDYDWDEDDGGMCVCSPWEDNGIDQNDIEKVVIGDNITKIGKSWFQHLPNLTEVKLGKNTKKIGSFAFFNCSSLKKINVGKNLVEIGDCAFEYCNSLKSVNLGDKLKKMGSEAFADCKNLSGFYIGKSLKTIGNNAFSECDNLNLQKVKIHSKNKYFAVDDNLLVNKQKTKIYFGCFTTNTTCKIGNNVTKINSAVLKNPDIENFQVNSKNKLFSAEDGVLYSKDGTKLLICPRAKKGTVVVSEKAVRMDSGYTTDGIKASPFLNCAKIEKIIVGKNIKYIDAKFKGCSSLKEVEVDVKNEYYASAKGSILSKDKNKLLYYIMPDEDGTYTVPKMVSKVDRNAFSDGIQEPKHIVLSDEVRSFSKEMNVGCDDLTVGKNYYNDGDFTWFLENMDCENFKAMHVSEKNPYYSSVDGIVYNKEQTELLMCPQGATVCKMPNTVTGVAINEFIEDGCIDVKELYISDGITNTENWFKGNKLTKIYIGKSVKNISLANSDKLETIMVSAESQTYKAEDNVLYTKDGNELILCAPKKQGTVNVCSGTAIIKENAFKRASGVTEIMLPETVTTIEKGAFTNINKNAVFYVPVGKKTFYKSLLTSDTGFKSTMSIKEAN